MSIYSCVSDDVVSLLLLCLFAVCCVSGVDILCFWCCWFVRACARVRVCVCLRMCVCLCACVCACVCVCVRANVCV